jgi:hypothetical protein
VTKAKATREHRPRNFIIVVLRERRSKLRILGRIVSDFTRGPEIDQSENNGEALQLTFIVTENGNLSLPKGRQLITEDLLANDARLCDDGKTDDTSG